MYWFWVLRSFLGRYFIIPEKNKKEKHVHIQRNTHYLCTCSGILYTIIRNTSCPALTAHGDLWQTYTYIHIRISVKILNHFQRIRFLLPKWLNEYKLGELVLKDKGIWIGYLISF
jgi:hypothetical protein